VKKKKITELDTFMSQILKYLFNNNILFLKDGAIYSFYNKVNGKRYVGSSLYLKHRQSVHFSTLNNNKHKNNHLQNAWNKYKEENFEFLF